MSTLIAHRPRLVARVTFGIGERSGCVVAATFLTSGDISASGHTRQAALDALAAQIPACYRIELAN